jgi:broad specificity phosphatase PhoE
MARAGMTARLDLLAHAASEATRAARFPDDEPLEASAVVVLEPLCCRLRRYDRVLTAPARVARETAAALGLNADVEMALRDCDYGQWRGLALNDVVVREPDGFAAWLGDPAAEPHGGESVVGLIERTRVWLGESLLKDGATLAVTHASVIRALIVNALRAGPATFWRIDVAPLTIVRLSGRDGRWTLMALGPLGAQP